MSDCPGQVEIQFAHVSLWHDLSIGQALFQLEKNTETIENWVRITVELILLQHKSFPNKKFKLIMAELQEKSTVVVAKFSFKATEKRKKSEMLAKNSMNQEKVNHCLFLFLILEFRENRFGQNLFGFEEPNFI